MPLGLNRTDLNKTGTSYKNGSPITIPHNFGNLVALPVDFGNDVVTPVDFGNDVTWAPSPSHFGNTFPSTSQNYLLQADGVSLILLANGVDALLVS